MALTKINTNLIANNTIALTNIADNAIDATKIANNQILARHIAAGSISDQLAAAQPTITSVGTLTTLTVDDITLNNSTISDNTLLTISSGDDIVLDATSDIILDADGGDIRFKDGGTARHTIAMQSNGDVYFVNETADKDIYFKGVDGSSTITALTLDMSAAGAATFNSTLSVTDNSKTVLIAPNSSDTIYYDQANLGIRANTLINLMPGGNTKLSVASGGTTITGTTTSSGAITVSDGNSTFITGTSWGATLTLKNVNDDASPAILSLHKDPSSGHTTMANNDYIGFINMKAEDSSGNAHTYVELSGIATNVSHGGETSKFSINTWGNGTEYPNNVVVTGNAVGIGTSPSEELHIKGASGAYTIMRIESGSTSHGSTIEFADATDTDYGEILQFASSAGEGGRMRFRAGGTETMNLRGGKVGIGTSNPDQTLHVHKASAGSIASASDSVLTLENSSHAILQFLTPADKYAQIRFGDPSDSGNGWFSYDHDSLKMKWGTNGPAKMTLDSSGNLGIGTESPQYKFDVIGTSDITMRIHRPSSGLAATDTCGIGFSQRGDANTSNSDTRAGIFSTYNGNLFLATEPGGDLNSNPMDHSALMITGTDQYVGIGTTSPGDVLHVMETNAAAQIRIQRHEVDGILSDNDEIGALEFWTNDDTYASGASALRAKIMAEIQNTSAGSNLQFWTGNTTSAAVEQMRIIADGKVGIGTENPSVLLDVAGTATNEYALKLRGNIDNSGGYTGITFGYESDTTAYEKARIHVEGTSGSVQPEFHILIDQEANSESAAKEDAIISVVPGTDRKIVVIDAGKQSGGYDVDLPTSGEVMMIQGPFSAGYPTNTPSSNQAAGRWVHHWYHGASTSGQDTYTHIESEMWGGGSPNGNSEYIMGGFKVTGYRYGTGNVMCLYQFHNWSGTLHNVANDDDGAWTGAVHVYVSSNGYVTLRLDTRGSYRMFDVDFIQYSLYGKVGAAIRSTTLSTSATI